MTQLVLRDRPSNVTGRQVAATTGGMIGAEATSSAATIRLELISTFDAFAALEDEWNALQSQSKQRVHAFQGFNWCWHWCRHYLGDSRKGASLAIVTGRTAGRLVLVMPLVTQRKAGLVALTWLGEPVSQCGDVLATPAAANIETLEAAWRYAVFQTGADVANLRRVRDDAIAAKLLAHLGADVTAAEDAPFLDLSQDKSFAGWEARRRPRAMKNRRRQARRLGVRGEMRFHALSGGAEAAALAERAVELKRDSLTAKGVVAPALADVRFARFFADAAHGRGRPSGLTVMALTSHGAPAALTILIETKDTAFLHLAAVDPTFEKYGAGALLLEQVVERAILSERRELDLLPPRRADKLDVADGVVVVRDYAKALSARGWLYTRGFLRVRRQIKALVEALPKSVRRPIATLAGGLRHRPRITRPLDAPRQRSARRSVPRSLSGNCAGTPGSARRRLRRKHRSCGPRPAS